jgi:polynucleotide 5'-hydroxyl-kinase GRC3/NOL9
MSAIAAARLKAQSQVTSNHSLDATPSPVDVVSVASDVEDDEKEPLPPQRNVQLCTWRYGPDYVSSESKEQLTVSLKKFATITLTGCFDFAVLKGAININGANFGATPRSTQQKSTHRAFVPSTHPISVIRGLDSDNEIQFLDCDEPTPLAGLNPLFANIWSTKRAGKWPRSFELVRQQNLHLSIYDIHRCIKRSRTLRINKGKAAYFCR